MKWSPLLSPEQISEGFDVVFLLDPLSAFSAVASAFRTDRFVIFVYSSELIVIRLCSMSPFDFCKGCLLTAACQSSSTSPPIRLRISKTSFSNVLYLYPIESPIPSIDSPSVLLLSFLSDHCSREYTAPDYYILMCSEIFSKLTLVSDANVCLFFPDLDLHFPDEVLSWSTACQNMLRGSHRCCCL